MQLRHTHHIPQMSYFCFEYMDVLIVQYGKHVYKILQTFTKELCEYGGQQENAHGFESQ